MVPFMSGIMGGLRAVPRITKTYHIVTYFVKLIDVTGGERGHGK